MLTFVVPGSLHQISGGYLFDRRIVEGARALGRKVAVVELAGRFPDVDGTAREAAARSLASLPDGSIVVIDGLALPAYAECLGRHARRLRSIGFIHHPLSLETGLAPAEVARYADLETRLWRQLHGFICPSAATARALMEAGIDTARIAVASPGTDRPSSVSKRIQRHGLRLLAVGTISPRKGHDVLIEALAPLRSLSWQLQCVGSLERNPRFAGALRAAITRLALDDRIALRGELPSDRLDAIYAEADVFVLPSFHEGYGMAYAEALAHGLPVIATTAGAIPATVPASAALFVAPGNVDALRDALERIIVDAELRARLTHGAVLAGATLPTWNEAVAHWLACLDRLTA